MAANLNPLLHPSMNASLTRPAQPIETTRVAQTRRFCVGSLCLLFATFRLLSHAAEADLILHNGKVATVDERFSSHEAIAVQDGRIVQVGRSADVLKRGGPRSEVVDLQGKLVLPGLMDSHAHPVGACLTEFDHPIPSMESIPD